MILYFALALAAIGGMFVGYWARGRLDQVQRDFDKIQSHGAF